MKVEEVVKQIRKNWAISDAKRDEGLTTPNDIKRFDNISYGPHRTENLLDIYVQKNAAGPQPAIINVHGGGWVYGCKEIYQFYCMSLAQRGFTVVNINYRLAPESIFPAAVEDINNVMRFIAAHGEEYFIDAKKLVMVGDSAGGQLVSHYATILTNPDFAAKFDFELPDVCVRALGLNCGEYDGRKLACRFRQNLFKAYLGCKEPRGNRELLEKVDALKYMTSSFPASFISSAEGDFLKKGVEPMFRHLSGLGVPCAKKIYGNKKRKEVGHVFHVNIRLPEAKECNDDECAFFRKYV